MGFDTAAEPLFALETVPGSSPATLAAAADSLSRLMDVETIYHEPAALDHLRGREIFERFPAARRLEVRSHWGIPGLHGNEGLADQWLHVKRTTLVLGVKKSLVARPNGRSSDFIAPGPSNGCALACAYCYVPRRKGFANPITTFVNIEAICRSIGRHAQSIGTKTESNQVDPHLWVYDIGENGDCSVDAAISDNVRDLVELFRRLPNAKASFATKHVNRALLDYDPRGKTRVRFSLMPAQIAKLVDVRTSPMAERIAAINDFVAAGYEVHVNFSPVIVYDGWSADYAELFEQVDAALSPPAKKQLAAEIIFLTHNGPLHEINLHWHPKAEELLWQPRWQEAKVSETGGENVRYRHGMKGKLVTRFRELLAERMPYCKVRYAF